MERKSLYIILFGSILSTVPWYQRVITQPDYHIGFVGGIWNQADPCSTARPVAFTRMYVYQEVRKISQWGVERNFNNSIHIYFLV